MAPAPEPRVLVTGATGYMGGRLVPRLLEAGYRVRCLVRDPRKLSVRPWSGDPRVESFAGEAGDPEAVRRALEGCRVAYYLIHSMISTGSGYREEDRRLAAIFAAAAAEAKVERIIYLGGLGETGADLSAHLLSRREVEATLAAGPVPVTVLRAAMIIGAGSASFEILRYLVERLPAMVTPRWVRTECQPIAVQDALRYLVEAADHPDTPGRTLDIGGPDVMNYQEIMKVVAEALGLRRELIVPVPVLTPWLSSLWIHIVTPVGHRIARPLAEGLRNRVVCRNDEAGLLMPFPRLTIVEAVDKALHSEADPESSWLDAGPIPGDPDWAGGTVFEDRRETAVRAPAERTYAAVGNVGGHEGWFEANWLWQLRGALDRLFGGPGLGRGRRHPNRLAYGDVLDFWRVAGIEPGRRLSLRAEMRLPGEALLEFEVTPVDADRSRLVQIARFKPRGLLGLAYWWAVFPFHGIVFQSMLRGIRRRAEHAPPPPPLPAP